MSILIVDKFKFPSSVDYILNTFVTETTWVEIFEVFSIKLFRPKIPIKAKLDLYPTSQMASEPIYENHFLTESVKFRLNSSLHAAITI